MASKALNNAKKAKNDEFYTQWIDIEKEVQAYLEFNPDVFRGKTILCPCDDPYESNFFKYFALHFNEYGLKKLIATCYKGSSIANTQLSLFDFESKENKTTRTPHKIEITEVADYNDDKAIDLLDIEWLMANKKNTLTRLNGDGDFRSDEVKKLRDEADIIITNPPFSLFREFISWIGEKQFLIIGNMNAITYKEIFPLIKDNKMWLGATGNGSDMVFGVPKDAEVAPKDREKAAKLGYIGDYTRQGNSCWFTNVEHGRRHKPLMLETMATNLRYHKPLINKLADKTKYDEYDNYDAIEVPFTDAIPSDYKGAMGVPISFLSKYCPEQFEILSSNDIRLNDCVPYKEHGLIKDKDGTIKGQAVYARIIIKHKAVER